MEESTGPMAGQPDTDGVGDIPSSGSPLAPVVGSNSGGRSDLPEPGSGIQGPVRGSPGSEATAATTASRRWAVASLGLVACVGAAVLVAWRLGSRTDGGQVASPSTTIGHPASGRDTAARPSLPAPKERPGASVGYTRDELRPVLDQIAELAGAFSDVPAVGDSAPSTTDPPSTPAAPPGTGTSDSTASRPAVSPGAARPGPPAALGVAAVGFMVAAGFIAALARAWRRRRRRRPRDVRPGVEAGSAAPCLGPVEEPAPAAQGADPAQILDLALRHAGAELRARGREPVDAIVCVRVGELGVELLVDPVVGPALGRFRSSGDGHELTLDPACSVTELASLAEDHPPPLPGMITVGTSPEGPVLIDPRRGGVLSVEGDPVLVDAFLAGAALELATAPWATGTRLRLVGGDGGLTSDTVEVYDSVIDLTDVDAVVGDDISDAVVGAASTTAGLGATAQARVTVPTVVVVRAGASSAEALAALATRASGSSGHLALVAAGPVPGAAWRLMIGPDGDAVLEPLGLGLRCAVDADAVATTTAILARPVDEADIVALEAALGPDDDTGEVTSGVHVRILGPVSVDWAGRDRSSRPQRRKLEEVVAYLATHDERPVPAERLRCAIWPLGDGDRAGEVAHSTFRSTMSRTRTTLGRDRAGRPYLPEACDGRYRLGPGVECDWASFVRLCRRARTAPSGEAIQVLRSALTLVRGAPFADAPRGAYGWAWTEQLVSHIEVTVADAAEDLAERALDAGDCDTARWAAAKGLLAIPSRESLYRIRMRAAFATGDADDLDQAFIEVRRAALAVDTEPQGETAALYQRLRRACRADADPGSPAKEAVCAPA